MSRSQVETMIELRHVSRYYQQGESQIKAADCVDLKIIAGEFTALAGPSGSGKTTILNLIGGLDRPDSGSVWVGGEAIENKSDRQLTRLRLNTVGFVFQAYNLIPVLTARENAEFVMLIRGTDAQERHRRVDEVFEHLGLTGLADRFPRELSGGQQQRVAVARAVVNNPKIVLADEPTANLDSESAFSLIEMMRDLNQERGVTFVFSTHDSKIIDAAKRVVRLEDGRVVQDERRE